MRGINMRRLLIVLAVCIFAGWAIYFWVRDPTIRAEHVNVWEKWRLEVIPTKPDPHIVKRGETLDDIASLYEIGNREMTKDMIRELNSLWGINPRPGQALKVPEPNRNEWPVGMSWYWKGVK
jgi:hypothetical protein